MKPQKVRIPPPVRARSTKPKGTPEEQSLRRMRRYIADGLGFKLSQLPGFEASVLALAVEASMQRAEAKRLRHLVAKLKVHVSASVRRRMGLR